MTADELVAFAEDLAKIAAAGGGPKALADHLARRIQAGVLIEDAQWRHVAAAGSGVPGTVRGDIDPGATRFAPLRNGGSARTLPLSAGETRVGQITVFGEDLDRWEHAVRLAAGQIAVELAREGAGEAGRRRAFWDRLAGGEYLDAAAARDDAAARGITLAPHYIAVALEPETAEPANAGALRAAAANVFRSADGATGFLERANALVALVPAEREIDAANARTAAALLPRTIAKKHPDMRIGGGVGTRSALMDVRTSVDQAQAALSIARRLYGTGKVAAYDDLGAYPLLFSGSNTSALRAFAERTLAPLRAYDEKHQTELERTLHVYFASGENVKTAAEQLSVHRHTVFYRLRQIGEICRSGFDDPHAQLTLRMAIAIDALHSQ